MRAENEIHENDKENVRDMLDTLGLQWYQYCAAGNEDMQRTLQTEIFNIISKNESVIVESNWRGMSDELFADAVSEFYIKNLRRFDPYYRGEKRSFFSFVKQQIAYRMQDCYEKDKGIKRQKVEEEGKIVNKKREIYSLNEIENRKGGMSRAERPRENVVKSPEELYMLDEQIWELTMLFTKITEHLAGRQNNVNKQEYFKLFATENLTGIIKGLEDNTFLKKRERDILSALQNEFLDYYMTDICRNIKKIDMCPMKKHCDVEEGSQNEDEIEIPFSNKLYITYFQRERNRKIGDSAISMQRNSFRDLLKECVQR